MRQTKFFQILLFIDVFFNFIQTFWRITNQTLKSTELERTYLGKLEILKTDYGMGWKTEFMRLLNRKETK